MNRHTSGMTPCDSFTVCLFSECLCTNSELDALLELQNPDKARRSIGEHGQPLCFEVERSNSPLPLSGSRSWLNARVVSAESKPLSAPEPAKSSTSTPTFGFGNRPACSRRASAILGSHASDRSFGLRTSAAARAWRRVSSSPIVTTSERGAACPGSAGAS